MTYANWIHESLGLRKAGILIENASELIRKALHKHVEYLPVEVGSGRNFRADDLEEHFRDVDDSSFR